MRKFHKPIIIIAILIVLPSIISISPLAKQQSITNDLPLINPKIAFEPKPDYQTRKNAYLEAAKTSNSLHAQVGRAYLGLSVNEESIENSMDRIDNLEDCADFRMISLVRLMHINKLTNVISEENKTKIRDRILKFKYFYTEGGRSDTMIYWTENHLSLFHACELLAGLLYPNEVFENSGMTGTEHVAHARKMILDWIGFRQRFGFSEWHSNTYYTETLAALVNIVDYGDNEISTKAAMIIDEMAFGFAMNYYGDRYATSMGRAYADKFVGTSADDPPGGSSVKESAWLLLGITSHTPSGGGNMGAVALATSEKYAPPPILEDIANDALLYCEHKERNSINMADGPANGYGYGLDDMPMWLSLSAVLDTRTIGSTLDIINTYGVNADTIYGSKLFTDAFQIFANMRGVTISEFSGMIKGITQGVCLEAANIYTYRTPYYQLSGAQDLQKGLNTMQKHIWQATLDQNALVFTNSPGIVTQQFETWVGGWSPRATIYKNVGIIQYDRESLSLEVELLVEGACLAMDRWKVHAYFPQWAFDEVQFSGKWVFGERNDGYIALYCYEPAVWRSDIELSVAGRKNVWIVEMGSAAEYSSFDDFINQISQASINIVPEALGYWVQYDSPSQGLVNVNWNSNMYVSGNKVDLGTYGRWENKYCYKEVGTNRTEISFDGEMYVLDYDTLYRDYI